MENKDERVALLSNSRVTFARLLQFLAGKRVRKHARMSAAVVLLEHILERGTCLVD